MAVGPGQEQGKGQEGADHVGKGAKAEASAEGSGKGACQHAEPVEGVEHGHGGLAVALFDEHALGVGSHVHEGHGKAEGRQEQGKLKRGLGEGCQREACQHAESAEEAGFPAACAAKDAGAGKERRQAACAYGQQRQADFGL